MKKLIIVLVTLFLAMVGIVGCEKNKDSNTPTNECGKIDINKNEFISMKVQPEKVSVNSQIKLIIENHTKEDMIYDNVFSLEYFNGSSWETMKLDINFEDIGYILKSEKTAEQQIYLSAEDYDYKAGKYRINKNISNDKNYNLCAEFEFE
ncbi:MAG: hypothetical protein LBN27_02195 [Prevotellaceae bacterium]|jgi:hypothetical protein|nr:hypothetical protein [Prevotellaceae bacterium]